MKGLPHELGSTGFGVFHSVVVAARHKKLKLKGATVAIEGFGNVGSFAAKFLEEHGAKVVAASDSKGCLYEPNGIDVKTAMTIKEKTRSILNYNGGKRLECGDIFTLPVDILIPAALPNVINKHNWLPNMLHSNLNQCVAATGRLSSTKPNQQNLPKEAKLYCISRY